VVTPDKLARAVSPNSSAPHHIGDQRCPSIALNPGQVFTSGTTCASASAGSGFGHRF
jgi:hypothetical protein